MRKASGTSGSATPAVSAASCSACGSAASGWWRTCTPRTTSGTRGCPRPRSSGPGHSPRRRRSRVRRSSSRGDFNLRRPVLPGYSAPGPGIDHVLVRGVVARPLVTWSRELRVQNGAVLSDHAPVERGLPRAGHPLHARPPPRRPRRDPRPPSPLHRWPQGDEPLPRRHQPGHPPLPRHPARPTAWAEGTTRRAFSRRLSSRCSSAPMSTTTFARSSAATSASSSPPAARAANYNYNDNSALCEAIRLGVRRVFWDILRREADSHPSP